MRPSRRSGFTLAEMAIVLVIIGLVAGSVFVGRELIRAAEVQSLVRQVSMFDSAVNAFVTKNNCLPGDCPAAPQSGNGNGVIHSVAESNAAWIALKTAGFVKDYNAVVNKMLAGAPALSPQTKSQAFWNILYYTTQTNSFIPNAGHYYWLTANTTPNSRGAAALGIWHSHGLACKLGSCTPGGNGRIFATGADNVVGSPPQPQSGGPSYLCTIGSGAAALFDTDHADMGYCSIFIKTNF